MLNTEKLIYMLLKRGLHDVAVIPELDVTSIDDFPLVTFSVSGGNAVLGSSSPPKAWDVVLNLSVFHDDLDAAIDLAGRVYDIVWGWDEAWNGTGIIDSVGHAAEIEDQSVFSRLGTVAIGNRSVTQLAGGFGLQVHDA